MTKKTPLPPLTPKEKSVLEFIESHILSSGVSPSYQEIKDHFGLASFNSVQNYLKQLTNKGYIENPLGQKRAIQVLHSSSAVQEHLQSKLVSTKTGSPRSQLLQAREEILSLPLLGKVAAGQPIESLKYDEFIDVPPSMVKNPTKAFALKVQGDSMIEDGIFNEDIILVHKQNSANNGDIVVATIENEATVKRFYMDKKSMIELRPSNSNMKSMWYNPEDVEIRGIVTGLIRKF
ncbi:MAG: transcriptional repressor LexA [Pseudobdellovibrionaceae bacterium]